MFFLSFTFCWIGLKIYRPRSKLKHSVNFKRFNYNNNQVKLTITTWRWSTTLHSQLRSGCRSWLWVNWKGCFKFRSNLCLEKCCRCNLIEKTEPEGSIVGREGAKWAEAEELLLIQRQPDWRARAYPSTDDGPLSWSSRRYVLCDEEIK